MIHTLIYRKKNIYKHFDSFSDLMVYAKKLEYRFVDFNYKYSDPLIKLSPLFNRFEPNSVISVVLI